MRQMIPVVMSVALMSVSLAGAAGFSVDKMRAVAAEIGAALPEAPVPVVVPAAASAVAPVATESIEVTGEGMVEGNASVSCSDSGNGAGMMNGTVMLKGEVPVSTKDGAKGKIFVSGGGLLDGFCRAPFGGTASGFVNMRGTGVLVWADGRPSGTVEVKGQAMVSVNSSGGRVWTSVPVTVKGILVP